MFEDLASLEAHIDACAGNQVCSPLLAWCCLQINFLKEQGWAQEGYQCSLCWANGEVLIVTTVDAFNAHTAEVHGGESVPEVAESEVQFEEGGGGLDKEIRVGGGGGRVPT